jgi:prepilin-type N-terminal cleavage/methylation domain-containing protein
MKYRARTRQAFTLLEVMLAVAIMAIALGSVFSAEAGSAKMAQRARKLGFATLLSRCKMGEIEEEVGKKGLPTVLMTDSDHCCKDAPIEGFKCKWEIVPIVLPDTMFGKDDDDKAKAGGSGAATSGPNASNTGTGPNVSSNSKGGMSGLFGAVTAALGGKKPEDSTTPDPSKTKDGKTDPNDKSKQDPKDALSKDPSNLLAGGKDEHSGGDVDSMTSLAMQYVYPILKPAFQSQIRRATVTVGWSEGSADKTFELTQYIVAEQPVPLATDPNNPNALLGAGTGTTGTGSTTIGTGTSTTPGLGGLGLTR